MSDRIFFTSSVAALAAIGAAFFIYSQSANSALAAEDGPGPNLVIEVGGQAQGKVVIDLLPDVAPKHVAQIVALAKAGAYNDVVFHRVIDGFMAQTGDGDKGNGVGKSKYPNIAAEFSNVPFRRGVVGMARATDPNSANCQFFIMFNEGSFLNGKYTVVGEVVSGMENVDRLKRGEPVQGPDMMTKVQVAADIK